MLTYFFFFLKLSERIYDFHQNTEQNQMQLNRKLLLRDQLYYAISPIFPCIFFKYFFLFKFSFSLVCGLYIVGSSLNGFGTLRSDLDLCLMITNRDVCLFFNFWGILNCWPSHF